MNTVPSALPTAASDSPASTSSGQRARPMHEFPALANEAVDLLRTQTALAELSPDDARCVVSYMWRVAYNTGVTVLHEGDREHTGFMLLMLRGEVSVRTTSKRAGDATEVSVLGAGHLIGEMGVLDGAPRSMTCVAAGPVEAAALTRTALHRLIEEHPLVGARLMAAVAQRLAERLRATDQQVSMYGDLVESLQREIERLKAGR